MRKLSAVLITHNEEEKIEAGLESLRDLCEEIVVVDSYSSDATVELCRRYTDRVYQEEWRGYVGQKQFATDLAQHDWVLSLDGDEKLSSELRHELKTWKAQPDDGPVAYEIPRLTLFMGRWIRHTTWYPDFQIRLFKKSRARWGGGQVHEGVRVEGIPARLSGHLLHYTYSSFSEYLTQLENFSTLAAIDYRDRGKKVSPIQLVLSPPGVFLKNFVIKAGFLEGLPGFVVSVLASVSTFFKYIKLWELQGKYGTDKLRWGKSDKT